MSVIKIQNGPNKGYYSLPGRLDREDVNKNTYIAYEMEMRQLAGARGIAWYKYSPGPGKTIKGFNKQYLPRYGNYYYVAKDPSIDLRRQLYALETMTVPADGNTERFNLELNKVTVPSDWCPYYLDPCNTDWCQKCRKRSPAAVVISRAPSAVVSEPTRTVKKEQQDWRKLISRWYHLFIFSALLAIALTIAVLSKTI
jgi:hypothetical protein